MAIHISVPDVPKEVRDELASRAARQGKSLEDYLRVELTRLAGRLPLEQVLARIRERKDASGKRVTAREILDARDFGRE